MITYDGIKFLLFNDVKEHFSKNPSEFATALNAAIEIVKQYVDLGEATTLPDRLKLPVAMLIGYFNYTSANKSDEDSYRKYEKIYDRAIALLSDKVVPTSTLGEMEGLLT